MRDTLRREHGVECLDRELEWRCIHPPGSEQRLITGKLDLRTMAPAASGGAADGGGGGGDGDGEGVGGGVDDSNHDRYDRRRVSGGNEEDEDM